MVVVIIFVCSPSEHTFDDGNCDQPVVITVKDEFKRSDQAYLRIKAVQKAFHITLPCNGVMHMSLHIMRTAYTMVSG